MGVGDGSEGDVFVVVGVEDAFEAVGGEFGHGLDVDDEWRVREGSKNKSRNSFASLSA